jgi:UDP-glucuronate 4-epimerase
VVLRQDARRIIITGAAGFIGFHVAERLLRAGWSIAGVDNLNSYYDPSLKEARLARLRAHSGFEFAKLDLENSPAFRDLMARFAPDAVIHLAAQAGVRYSLDHPEAYLSNVSGFLTVLEACRHHPVSHLIYASSSSVYGMNGKIPFSEHDIADHPVSLYAATKRANELMAHTYAHLYGTAATGLRFFTVYGPWGRPDMAYFKFARAIAAGEPIEVYNDGRMERDFTYIDDVVDALVSLIGKPPTPDPGFDRARPDPARSDAPHRLFNIGNNAPVTLSRFIEAVESAFGRKAQRRLLPMQSGDVPRTYADIDELAGVGGRIARLSEGRHEKEHESRQQRRLSRPHGRAEPLSPRGDGAPRPVRPLCRSGPRRLVDAHPHAVARRRLSLAVHRLLLSEPQGGGDRLGLSDPLYALRNGAVDRRGRGVRARALDHPGPR